MEGKKRGWWCWAGVPLAIIGIVIAYPLSLGPVAWLASDTGKPEWLHAIIDIVYAPVFASFPYVPRSLVLWYVGYLSWWDR